VHTVVYLPHTFKHKIKVQYVYSRPTYVLIVDITKFLLLND